MRLAIRREPFDSPDWVYELKWDGFRALAHIRSGTCDLVSRNAHVYKAFADLRESLAQLPHDAILDGEIVCLDVNGCPDFNRLFYRRKERYFMAFDIPYLDGRDLRDLPLLERKRILRGIVPAADPRLLYASHIVGKGSDLFHEVCRLGSGGNCREVEERRIRIRRGDKLGKDQEPGVLADDRSMGEVPSKSKNAGENGT